MTFRNLPVAITLAVTILLTQVITTPRFAYAGGLELYEYGTPAVGLAGAGDAARAQDASTLFTNPAGMTHLDRSQVMVGIQPTYGSAHFDRDQDTTMPGRPSGNPVGFVPGGSFFYVNDVSPDWKVGFGSLSYFGMPIKFTDDWSGRYYSQESTLLGMTFMPSVAYKFDEHLSFGVGLNAMYGYMKQKMAVNNLDPSLGDGTMRVSDGDWGFGADVGVMYDFDEDTRIGLRYLSQVSLDFNDTPSYSDLGPGLSRLMTGSRSLDMGMKVPTDLMFSVYHKLDQCWAVLGSAGWQDWSKFGKVDVTIDGQNGDQSGTADINTNDTWNLAVGMQNHSLDSWIFSAGIGYDSSMLAAQNRPVSLPVSSMWRFGVGSQYLYDTDVTLGFAYELGYAGDIAVDQYRGPLAGQISGKYGDTFMNFWALSVQWKL